MTTEIHAGALLDRFPGRKYCEALDYCELSLEEPLPRPGTLAKWRARVGDGLHVALVAPPSTWASAAGPLRFDDDLEAGVSWLAQAADALAARAVVLATGKHLTTGQRDRGRLERWIERVGLAPGRDLVWSSGGLWEPETASRFARRLGVVCAFDPLVCEAPPGEVAYARLPAVGGRTKFTDAMLLDALDVIGRAEAARAFVAIDSPRSFREAKLLAKLAAGDG